jgi:hypothetical protein
MACPQPPRWTHRRRQREDLDAHPPPPARPRRRRAALRADLVQPGRLGALLALLMLGAGAALTTLAPSTGQHPEHAAAVELPDAGEPDAGVVVDLRQDDGRGEQLGAERTIPREPERQWARPPCGPGLHEINGACWLRSEPLAVCPPGSYRHKDGRCYVPLAKAPRSPTSVEE